MQHTSTCDQKRFSLDSDLSRSQWDLEAGQSERKRVHGPTLVHNRDSAARTGEQSRYFANALAIITLGTLLLLSLQMTAFQCGRRRTSGLQLVERESAVHVLRRDESQAPPERGSEVMTVPELCASCFCKACGWAPLSFCPCACCACKKCAKTKCGGRVCNLLSGKVCNGNEEAHFVQEGLQEPPCCEKNWATMCETRCCPNWLFCGAAYTGLFFVIIGFLSDPFARFGLYGDCKPIKCEVRDEENGFHGHLQQGDICCEGTDCESRCCVKKDWSTEYPTDFDERGEIVHIDYDTNSGSGVGYDVNETWTNNIDGQHDSWDKVRVERIDLTEFLDGKIKDEEEYAKWRRTEKQQYMYRITTGPTADDRNAWEERIPVVLQGGRGSDVSNLWDQECGHWDHDNDPETAPKFKGSSNIMDISDIPMNERYCFYAMDYRGYTATNPGDFGTIAGGEEFMQKDGRVMFDYVFEEHDGKKVIVGGTSLGCATSLSVVDTLVDDGRADDVAGMFLLNGFLDGSDAMKDVVKSKVKFDAAAPWEAFWSSDMEWDNVGRIKKFRKHNKDAEILFYSSTDDDIIPFEKSEGLYKAAKDVSDDNDSNEILVTGSGGHSDIDLFGKENKNMDKFSDHKHDLNYGRKLEEGGFAKVYSFFENARIRSAGLELEEINDAKEKVMLTQLGQKMESKRLMDMDEDDKAMLEAGVWLAEEKATLAHLGKKFDGDDVVDMTDEDTTMHEAGVWLAEEKARLANLGKKFDGDDVVDMTDKDTAMHEAGVWLAEESAQLADLGKKFDDDACCVVDMTTEEKEAHKNGTWLTEKH